MKKFFKQLFCIHIYKDVKEEYLGRTKNISYVVTKFFSFTYDNYAIHKKCIKCDKEKIIVKQKIVI